MITSTINNSQPDYEQLDKDLSKEQYEQLYRKPEQVIEFMDYSNDQDNSRYIPNLMPGMLQPLEELSDVETDQFLSTIDIDALVKEAENSTGGIPNPVPAQKDLKCFGKPTSQEDLNKVTNHSFSTATKRKALWAACIFDQWKCIHNYKLKVDKELTYPEIKNLELDIMCETLCMFILKIWKQNGEEYL